MAQAGVSPSFWRPGRVGTLPDRGVHYFQNTQKIGPKIDSQRWIPCPPPPPGFKRMSVARKLLAPRLCPQLRATDSLTPANAGIGLHYFIPPWSFCSFLALCDIQTTFFWMPFMELLGGGGLYILDSGSSSAHEISEVSLFKGFYVVFATHILKNRFWQKFLS